MNSVFNFPQSLAHFISLEVPQLGHYGSTYGIRRVTTASWPTPQHANWRKIGYRKTLRCAVCRIAAFAYTVTASHGLQIPARAMRQSMKP